MTFQTSSRTGSAISVVVMAFNEASSLEAVVRKIVLSLEGLGRQYEVIIVDDGSSDDTGLISEHLCEEFAMVKVIHHSANEGLGGVYRTGFAKAQNDLVTFFPADGQFPASLIRQFAPLMECADMVLGYLPHRNCSLLVKSLSKAEKLLYKLLFGYLPEFQGILMFQRGLLNEFELKSSGRGWTVLMELIIRTYRSGHRILNVPIEVQPRMSGKSKVNNLPTILDNLKQVFSLRWHL
jgi:glycosyltransferase involved in cell wall biosynthesis